MTTLKEIAKAAGVSTTTVSNVINGNHKRVSRETIAQIQAIVRQSGYIPNQAARSLAQRESRFIAVIIQADADENSFLNPYNAAYAGAITVNLYRYGYYPLIRFTDDFHTVERDIKGWNVAGAIFNGSYNRYLQQIESLEALPSVFVDCFFNLPGVSYVEVADETGGRLAGDYLREMGHRRVGFIANDLEDSIVEQRRLAGLRQSLEAGGLAIPEAFVFPTSDYDACGDRLIDLVRRPDGPTAFLCCADLAAIRLMRHFEDHGIRVPGDVSVVGFDNLPLAELCTPQLTTVAQGIDEKARLAVELLVRHIQDRSLPPERAELDVRLIARKSVKRLEE